MITLRELKNSTNRVTSVIFLKKSFNLESIIRWLIDREFHCDNFIETEKFYVFRQGDSSGYSGFEYEILSGDNIVIELGMTEGGLKRESIDLDKLINL